MTAGIKANADGSAAIQVGGSDAITITSGLATTFAAATSVTGNLSFNSGYGSSAVAYGCRAWVNFNGTGTVAIRASGNVTSITDNGTGNYSVNFTTAMPDTNYAAVGSTQGSGFGTLPIINVNQDNDQTVSKVDVVTTVTSSGTATDLNYITVAVFR